MARKRVNALKRKHVKQAIDAADSTRHFYLNDIAIWESSFQRDREFRWGEHTPDTCLTQTFRSVEPQVVEVDVQGADEKRIMLRALVRLGLRIIPKDEQEEEDPSPIYSVEAAFMADYFILVPPSEEVFQDFVDFNCIHNVWPFWRQHVFTMLKNASLPVPAVPLFAGQSKYRRKRVNVSRVIAGPETAVDEAGEE